jgi:hypothetical protein
MSEIQVSLAFADAGEDAERTQLSIQQMLPLLREVEVVEKVELLTEKEIPDGAKSMGAMVVGAAKFTVANSNILKGLGWVGDRLING